MLHKKRSGLSDYCLTSTVLAAIWASTDVDDVSKTVLFTNAAQTRVHTHSTRTDSVTLILNTQARKQYTH